jgi:hypothetical protein
VVVERTRALPPAPGMEPTRQHAQEPQDRSQREELAGPIHGAQDPHLGASVRQALFCEAKPGGSEQGQHEPEQRRELLDASPQLEDLLLEFRFREIRHIQTAHDRWRRAEPATRRRARDAEVRGDGHVPGAVDQMPKPVVVALLRAIVTRTREEARCWTRDEGRSFGATL